MEQICDTLELLDMIPRAAFCVHGGRIIKVNPAASAYFIEPGAGIQDLLLTGAEEYSEFTGGRLYLNLNISGQVMGFSVSRVADADLFRLEQESDSSELQALALAARELRDPLASVLITAERLFPDAEPETDPAVLEKISRLNRGLYQLQRIISNMSDAGRYTADTGTRQEVRNICGILDEVFARAAILVEHTGITLEYEGFPEPIYTLADAEKLERAVFNIISNSLKFTPKGGSIRASLTKRGSKLYLSIQDSGSGIAEQVRSDVYTRYTREPVVEDGRYGIGLGMVLIRAAATVHGGTVLIDQPGETGTRITISLAIRPGSSTQVRSPILRVDYAGERDHGLLELSESLPAHLYEPET